METLIFKIIEVAGLGGFCAFMIWYFMKSYIAQQKALVADLMKDSKEERRIREQTDARLFTVINDQAETMVSTGVTLQQYLDKLDERGFCPLIDKEAAERRND